jgi:hypothetical protein
VLFYEYFHGDNGAGLGASHQTGWTGIVARLMHLFAATTPEQMLELGKMAAVGEAERPRAAQLVGAGAGGDGWRGFLIREIAGECGEGQLP